MPENIMAATEIFIWGTITQGSEKRSPPEAKAVADIVHILTAETIKIGKFCTIHILILDHCVSS